MGRKSRKPYLCLDCHVDTGRIREYYMLRDAVWRSVVSSDKGMLCIGCLEHRLGRQLVRTDFNDSHVNDPKKYGMSLRLLSRITGYRPQMHAVKYKRPIHPPQKVKTSTLIPA